MRLFKATEKILCRLVITPSGRGPEFDEVKCEEELRREAVDWIYAALGVFTYLYLVTLAVVFFGGLEDEWRTVFVLLDSLQEPYLGALGIYVILKEIRKRRRDYPSRYAGEFFVALWLLFLLVSTLITIFSPEFNFAATYKIILTNSLVALIAYIGSLIHN